ncbi:MAG TPA: PAS domain S-box protein [Gaiellaceae bacterium]|nr:PAS domain S-box protein [Gaiellaceae bacterium]
MNRVSISELIVALEDGAPLRDALASALGDDRLAVFYWLDQRQGTAHGGWVDPQGHAAGEPSAGDGRSVKLVEQDGTRIAAIDYDAALDGEPELLDAVTAAVGLALRNDRLQAELRAEVEFWDTVTNTVPSLLVTVGTDGAIRNLNAAAVDVAGYGEKDDVLGRDYWDVFIDPSERPEVMERFATLAPAFAAGEYENVFVNARGERRVVFWRTAPVHDESGDVIAIVSGGADITMRRKREVELERERDVQTTVFESMPSIMVALAGDGTIRDRDADDPRVGANRAFRRVVRWPDEQIVGRSFLDLVVEDEDGRAARAIEMAAAGAMSEEVESEFRSADGSSRVFVWSAIPIADVTGRMNRLVLVCGADITERKRLEAENELERAFLNAIANNAPSLLCLIDADGVMTERGANIAFERTLEYDPEEIGGQVFWQTFVDPSEADDVRAAVQGVAAGEPPAERDNTWRTKTGRRLSMAWTCTPLPRIDERTLFLVTALDITERKRADDELRASRARLVRAEETARRELERNLHDGAQQRLVALSVALRLVESRLDADPDAAQQLLTGAQTELAQALEDLRELARGIHPAVLTDRGLRAALETLAARASFPVELDAPPERLAADVEAAAYYVVAESLTNVAKYAHATSARVTVGQLDGSLVVTVTDDGIGGADPDRGSGLRGLADRVAVLEGTLGVDSPPGGGTTIRAELPLPE